MKPTRFIIGLLLLTLLLLFVALAPGAQAFDARAGDDVVIAADEVVDDDLYVSANTFTLDGVIKGDLIVVGSIITINGAVEGDIMGAGQTLIINGEVMDDARVAGLAITLGESGKIGDDLIGAGYSIDAQAGSSVGGDVVVVGNQIILAGSVSGDVGTASSSLALRGSVGGNVDADVGEATAQPPFSPFMFMPNAPTLPTVPAGLTVSGAQIAGTLTYSSPQEYTIPEGAAGAVNYNPVVMTPDETEEEEEVVKQPTLLDTVLKVIRWFITLLLLGLLLVWLLPKFMGRLATLLEEKPLPSLGWGAVAFIAALFVIFLLIMAVALLMMLFGLLTLGNLVGLTLAVGGWLIFTFTLAFVLVVVYLSKLLVSIWLGKLILRRVSANMAESRVWPLVVGLIIVVLITAIPWVGGLISFLISLLGLGAVWLWLQARVTSRQQPAEAIEAVDR